MSNIGNSKSVIETVKAKMTFHYIENVFCSNGYSWKHDIINSVEYGFDKGAAHQEKELLPLLREAFNHLDGVNCPRKLIDRIAAKLKL